MISVEALPISYVRYKITFLVSILTFLFVLIFTISTNVSSFFLNNTSSSNEVLTFSVSNEYTERHGNPGAQYHWINFPVVEPFKKTFLEMNVSSEFKEKYTYEWKVNDTALTGYSTNHIFTKLGYYMIEVNEIDKKTNQIFRTASQQVVCRYVRREIRSLTDEDRLKFFQALEVLYQVPSETGKQIYGPKYKDSLYFIVKHNKNAGDMFCDHFHDGYGFLNTHAALTLEFETALQVVEPSVSVPYWDYTIDSENAGDNIEVWRSSEIFQDDWYGEAAPLSGVLSHGRFAYIPITYFTGDTPHHNAHGMLRAPWNQNNIPYLTRFSNLYGFTYTETPKCEDHYNLLKLTKLTDFIFNSAYAPHGTMHIFLGGITGADWKSYLKEWSYPYGNSSSWVSSAFAIQKNLFRSGVLQCPVSCSENTTNLECKCSCPNYDYYATNQEALLLLLSSVFTISPNDYAGYELELFNLICNKYDDLGPMIGDQLESASPTDPLFWPIHPTIDRLFQWRRINGFTDMKWVDNAAWSVKGFDHGYCHGHNYFDVLDFNDLFEHKSDVYTNEDILHLFNPEQDYSPYIYDNFRWEHCVDKGFDQFLL